MTIDRAAPAAVRETHTATVFLTGDRAYKLKKAVDLGFLDFRTRSARRAACHREVALNRRFAPDVYLGIADVMRNGRLTDHLVVMRRMPDDRRLSTLVRQGADIEAVVEALARMMATCHAMADRGTAISEQGTKKALARRWEDSFAAVTAGGCVDAGVLAEITGLVREFLAGRDTLFAERIAEGRIVDGHGDLLADDIFWLDDGPRVLDCLEFDDRLRWLDGLDDVCFLAMDLEHLGAPGAATLLIARYLEFSGDNPPAALHEHYLAYRAFVRAKVASLRHEQDQEPGNAQLARDYAGLALEHLRRGQVELVVVGGLPGTGKTTVAGRIADRDGAVLLSSDRIRKELAGFSPAEHHASGYRTGLYTADRTEQVYDELLRRAEMLLGRGESVVLDASWLTAAHRARAAQVARRTHSAWRPVRCTAPTNVIIDRLRRRTDTVSDADVSVMSAMAVEMDPWSDATVVTTTGTVDAAATAARVNR